MAVAATDQAWVPGTIRPSLRSLALAAALNTKAAAAKMTPIIFVLVFIGFLLG